VEKLLADEVGSKTVVFEFMIGVNDENAAVMNRGDKRLLVLEFIDELKTRNNLPGNFVRVSCGGPDSPVTQIGRSSYENANFEPIFDLADMNLGDATGRWIGVCPSPDKRGEVQLASSPVPRFNAAIVVQTNGVLSRTHASVWRFLIIGQLS
jgi:hypothetical protein